MKKLLLLFYGGMAMLTVIDYCSRANSKSDI